MDKNTLDKTACYTYVESLIGISEPEETFSFYPGQKVQGFTDAVYEERIAQGLQGGLSTVHKIYDREKNVQPLLTI